MRNDLPIPTTDDLRPVGLGSDWRAMMRTYQFGSYTERYDETILARIPDITLQTIERYVQRGVYTGDFLQAVISNDLREAVGRADDGNLRALHEIVKVFYNYCPGQCWGNREAYKNWVDRGGLEGIAKDRESKTQTTKARTQATNLSPRPQ